MCRWVAFISCNLLVVTAIAQLGDQTTSEQIVLNGRGRLVMGDGRCVLVRDEDGEAVVGRVHVSVGDTDIVTMPDGQLKSFDKSDSRPTSDPFEPMDSRTLKQRVLRNSKLSEFETLESRRFLYVYNTSDSFIKGTRTILETMYPAVRKFFQRTSIETHEPEFPLVVLAFRDEDDFQDFQRMAPGISAYYSSVKNCIVLYEQSRLSNVAPEIALKNTVSTIAHEGVHQILHNIGVQARLSRWPMWLSEGLPEFFAPTSTGAKTKWKGLGAINDLRMYEIERKLKESSERLGSGIHIKAVVSAERLDSIGYAYSWSIIHMLAKMRQKELFACIKECNGRLPLAYSSAVDTDEKEPTAQEVFEKHFGDDYSELETALLSHLKRQNYVNPVDNQTHYLVVWAGEVTMTTSQESVKSIREKSGGRAEVRSFANKALAERALRVLGVK